MLRRFSNLPQIGRRYFAAVSQLKPGDSVIWVDPNSVKHNMRPVEQDFHSHDGDRAWYGTGWHSQTLGTVLEVDKENNTVKVDFDMNPVDAYITGVYDCAPAMLQKIGYATIYDVKMNKYDGTEFDTSVLQGKFVLALNLEDRHMAKDSSWLNMKRTFQSIGADKLQVLFFPCFKFDQPASWLEEKLGLKLGEQVHLMEKLDVNGDNTQPAYQFFKTYYPGRVDWRYTQRSKATTGWNSSMFLMNAQGKVVDKLMGQGFRELKFRVMNEMEKEENN